MQKPTLIYFALRGRGEIIRLVLAEAGVDYIEHPVTQGGPPENGRPTDFGELKAAGLLAFEAVPVWEEPDGFRLAQSRAIENHLARAHGLYGASPREAAMIDQLLGGQDDLRNELRRIMTTEPAKRADFRAQLAADFLPRWMGYLDRILAANHGGEGFFVGDQVSVADLALYYILEMLRDNGFGTAVDRSPRLVAFAARIATRPRIKAYLESPKRPPLMRLPT